MVKARGAKRTTIVVGIDLAGSPRRDTGVCALRGMTLTSIETLHTDQEILDFIDLIRPDLVAIDAPLSLPPTGNS